MLLNMLNTYKVQIKNTDLIIVTQIKDLPT